MVDFVVQHLWTLLGTFVGGGVAGSLITLRITKKKHISSGGNTTDQSGARAGRDMIGGDQTKTRK